MGFHYPRDLLGLPQKVMAGLKTVKEKADKLLEISDWMSHNFFFLLLFLTHSVGESKSRGKLYSKIQEKAHLLVTEGNITLPSVCILGRKEFEAIFATHQSLPLDHKLFIFLPSTKYAHFHPRTNPNLISL